MEEEAETPFPVTLEDQFQEPVKLAQMENSPGDSSDGANSQNICGVGQWKPAFLQIFVNIKAFVAFSGTTMTLTQSLSMYLISQLTTIEKQFDISSSVSGFLSACNEIGYMSCILFISHFGRNYHIPRILGCAVCVVGLAGFLTSLPQFVAKPTDKVAGISHSTPVESMGKYICQINEQHQRNGSSLANPLSDCHMDPEEFSGPGLAIFIIAVGMILQGGAKTPRQSLTITYVDDNVTTKTATGMYVGILSFAMILGSVVAFMLGSVFSKIYVDINDPGFGIRDPRWIGAWWLGFMVFGGMTILSGLPILLFPKRLRTTSRKANKRQEPRPQSKFSIHKNIKEFFSALARLLTNPVYVCELLGTVLRFFTSIGTLTFAAKYVEVHFLVPTWKANLLIGTTKMVGCALGALVSGVIVSRLKLGAVGCAKMLAICVSVTVGGNVVMIMLSCPQIPLRGHDIHHSFEWNIPQSDNTLAMCIPNCQCRNTSIFPVCGSDGVNYASPCHGGCRSYTEKGFTDCSCIGEWKNGTASAGYCAKSSCGLLPVFIVFVTITAFTACLSAVPGNILTIRSVSERDKSLGLALLSFLISIAGFVLGPIIFGRLIDSTCIFWKTSCGKTGSCALYDIRSFRLSMFVPVISVDVICILLFLLCVYFARRRLLRERISSEIDGGENQENLL